MRKNKSIHVKIHLKKKTKARAIQMNQVQYGNCSVWYYRRNAPRPEHIHLMMRHKRPRARFDTLAGNELAFIRNGLAILLPPHFHAQPFLLPFFLRLIQPNGSQQNEIVGAERCCCPKPGARIFTSKEFQSKTFESQKGSAKRYLKQ